MSSIKERGRGKRQRMNSLKMKTDGELSDDTFNVSTEICEFAKIYTLKNGTETIKR